MIITKTVRKCQLAILLLVCTFFLVGLRCTSIALFDERAYVYAISLKVESLALMDKATEAYDSHHTRIESLTIELRKAHEYARGRPKNTVSAKQWEILIAEKRNLLGGFLRRWKEKSKLSSAFIDEAKGLVSDAFDNISALESGKMKPGDVGQ